MSDEDYELAPCGGCPQFFVGAELCECEDDDSGPLCPTCHRDWHTDDRRVA